MGHKRIFRIFNLLLVVGSLHIVFGKVRRRDPSKLKHAVPANQQYVQVPPASGSEPSVLFTRLTLPAEDEEKKTPTKYITILDTSQPNSLQYVQDLTPQFNPAPPPPPSHPPQPVGVAGLPNSEGMQYRLQLVPLSGPPTSGFQVPITDHSQLAPFLPLYPVAPFALLQNPGEQVSPYPLLMPPSLIPTQGNVGSDEVTETNPVVVEGTQEEVLVPLIPTSPFHGFFSKAAAALPKFRRMRKKKVRLEYKGQMPPPGPGSPVADFSRYPATQTKYATPANAAVPVEEPKGDIETSDVDIVKDSAVQGSDSEPAFAIAEVEPEADGHDSPVYYQEEVKEVISSFRPARRPSLFSAFPPQFIAGPSSTIVKYGKEFGGQVADYFKTNNFKPFVRFY